MNKGTLYIISAPSGTGKSTIVSELLASDENLCFSVSATTSKPREGETDGVSYYFMSKEEFSGLVESGGMLEHAEFCGNFYGTPKKPVFDRLAEGHDVIPPSLETLKRRLTKRGTDSEETISLRVAQAEREIGKAYNYDYTVINGDLDKAVADVRAIMSASKNMTKLNHDTLPSSSQILKNGESNYSLVIAVAHRAREIIDEAFEEKAIIDEKPVKTAVEQFARGEYRLIEDPSLKRK